MGRSACKPVLELSQIEIGDQADLALHAKCFKPGVHTADEAIDPGDDAIEHCLDAFDQAVCRLKREIAYGGRQKPPDSLDRLERPLKTVHGRIGKTDDALERALHCGG